MSVWPKPRHFEAGKEVVWLSEDVDCLFKRKKESQDALQTEHAGPQVEPHRVSGIRKTSDETEAIVQQVLLRTKTAMFKSHFFSKTRKGQDRVSQPFSQMDEASVVIASVEVQEILDPESPDAGALSEWYSLYLDVTGKFVIEIGSYIGINRAMATFVQLFQGHSNQQFHLYCGSCPLIIRDSPIFDHRGLNLDISRNRIYPSDVQRVLEGMWLNKMSKLHLHATDSQSWPLEIPSIPELSDKGAYDQDQIWTASDVQRIQEFGEERGIEVYFEIDLPGHTASIHHSFPELIVGYKQEPWDHFAKEPPAGQLKLNSEDVRDFICRLFDDFLPRIAQYTKLFHLGGDELNKKVYTLEEGLGSDSKETLQPLLQRFFDLCVSKLEEHGLTPIFWEECLVKWDIEVPKSAIFQSWRSQESLSKIVKQGRQALFGPCQRWYLDCGMGGWTDPDPENPNTPVKYPFADWCPPYKNWRTVYTYDPFEGIDEEAHRRLVRGGEVHLWSEMTDSVCLDFMLWPRVAAAAEVLWSGPSPLGEDVTRRLADMRERLVSLGIRSNMVQMEWSLRNPGSSTL